MTIQKKLEIGILGGTFDPIHNSHLYIAETVLQKLELDQIQFIPCPTPPHRTLPNTSVEDRVAMVKLAIQQNPKFQLNLLELNRTGPSYTIDTLKQLFNPASRLYFILGMDSFNFFEQWHDWQEIIDYCHLIVVHRPNYKVDDYSPLHNWYLAHSTSDIQELKHTPHGLIYTLMIPGQETSATQIRENLTEEKSIDHIVPPAVAEYIAEHRLYR